MTSALPIVVIGGRWFFRDDRLEEFRAVDNPHERIAFDDFYYDEFPNCQP